MTKAVVAVLVAVVLGMTALPADARSLHPEHGKRIEARPACARMAMVDDGEQADCTVPTYCQRKHRRVHRKHHRHIRHERGHICLIVPQAHLVS